MAQFGMGGMPGVPIGPGGFVPPIGGGYSEILSYNPGWFYNNNPVAAGSKFLPKRNKISFASAKKVEEMYPENSTKARAKCSKELHELMKTKEYYTVQCRKYFARYLVALKLQSLQSEFNNGVIPKERFNVDEIQQEITSSFLKDEDFIPSAFSSKGEKFGTRLDFSDFLSNSKLVRNEKRDIEDFIDEALKQQKKGKATEWINDSNIQASKYVSDSMAALHTYIYHNINICNVMLGNISVSDLVSDINNKDIDEVDLFYVDSDGKLKMKDPIIPGMLPDINDKGEIYNLYADKKREKIDKFSTLCKEFDKEYKKISDKLDELYLKEAIADAKRHGEKFEDLDYFSKKSYLETAKNKFASRINGILRKKQLYDNWKSDTKYYHNVEQLLASIKNDYPAIKNFVDRYVSSLSRNSNNNSRNDNDEEDFSNDVPNPNADEDEEDFSNDVPNPNADEDEEDFSNDVPNPNADEDEDEEDFSNDVPNPNADEDEEDFSNDVPNPKTDDDDEDYSNDVPNPKTDDDDEEEFTIDSHNVKTDYDEKNFSNNPLKPDNTSENTKNDGLNREELQRRLQEEKEKLLRQADKRNKDIHVNNLVASVDGNNVLSINSSDSNHNEWRDIVGNYLNNYQNEVDFSSVQIGFKPKTISRSDELVDMLSNIDDEELDVTSMKGMGK